MGRFMISYRAMLALSVAGAALMPAGAHAQQAAESDETDMIVVTAQKREEIVQDVPLSISVVSGNKLQESGASQLTDYGPYVPGFQVDSAGTPGQSTLSLRGIAPIGPSTTVGTYVDDAPVGSSTIYARSSAFALDLLPYDVQRVEILRGPQGTLYGASSIGGLLKYVTIMPSLGEFSGRAGAEIFDIRHGGDVGYAGQAMVNAPLVTDKLGVTASYAYRKTPGYVDSVGTGQRDQNDYRQQGGRVSLLWQPTSEFSVRLSGLWQSIDANGNASVVEDLATGARIGDGLSNNNLIDEPFRKTIHYYAATLNYDLGFAALTSASTYSRVRTFQLQDGSPIFGVLFPVFGGPAGIAPFKLELNLKKVTQEVRLASPSDDRFEWMIGGFYTYEKSDNTQVINSYQFDGTPIPGLDPLATAALPSKYREYAFFGNAAYKFSKRFDITGGLRWARNKQKFRQITQGAIVPTADDPGTSSESVVTYSISPRLHLNEDSMIYGRVATGYRPGGPNVKLPGVAPSVDSDTLTNYELGLKSFLFGHALAIDAAAFYMDWKDIQQAVDFNGVTGLANAGSAVSKGFEASLTWRPARGLQLGANGAYTDARLTEDTPPAIGGRDGDRLPRIPKWSGSLTADYNFAVGSNTARLGAGLRHVGKRLSEVESSPNSVVAAAYTALDLNAELTIDKRWSIRLYGRNVTDSDGAVTRDLVNDGFGQPSFFRVTPVQPRTIGLAVDLSF